MQKLVEVKNLYKEFPIKAGFFNKKVGAVHAINNISFDIYKNETLGLLGESGCGKSTTGRCIIGLLEATKGSIKIDDVEISAKNKKGIKDLRRKSQIIFQNPYSSLNPRMTVEEILKEPLIIHKVMPKKDMNNRIYQVANMVGLSKSVLDRYPHQFSGGQRQRIGIGRALMLEPSFIVADEPVSALDVSIQAQIINLLEDLKKELNLTYLFISHDLSVVRHICDRAAVMYLGEIVEIAPIENLFESPQHPYTKALLSAVPVPDPEYDLSKRIILKGDIPSPVNPPSGCKFHTRCPEVMEICKNIPPIEQEVTKGHYTNCHLFNTGS